MNLQKKYLFESRRLGFRNWLSSDVDAMSEINRDPEVMRFFPSLKTKEETADFIERMKKQLLQKHYTYFAVDVLQTSEFIGFMGLSEQTFESDFTPCVDIGWRLKRSVWHRGYATEGAKACLDYAFDTLHLEKVVAIAPVVNQASIRVMEKLGMRKLCDFKHPSLNGFPHLETCAMFEIPSYA